LGSDLEDEVNRRRSGEDEEREESEVAGISPKVAEIKFCSAGCAPA
jgi:hypothetical protein